MAQIDEERLLLRFSTLIRDTESNTTYTLLTESIRANVELLAQAEIETRIFEANLPISVIVEATIANI